MFCIKAWCNIVLLGNTKPGKLDVYSKLGGAFLGSINVSDFNKLDAYHKLEMLQVRASKLMLHPKLTSNFLGIPTPHAETVCIHVGAGRSRITKDVRAP